MPFDRCGGGQGPTGLTANDLWDVSRRGTAELHINWEGYRVPLELPIDPDEVHCFDRVVTVDMPLPTWGETKLARNKASRPLRSKRASGKKDADTYDPTIRSRSSLDQLIPKPRVLNPQPDGNASYEGHGSL